MTLHVHTARIDSRDPDRLDITRKSGTVGLFLAPSWKLLEPAITARREGVEDETTWALYTQGFTIEMRRSYAKARPLWDALLARPRVVLVCYCTSAERCHRALLRERILPRLGAVDAGEIVEPKSGLLFPDGGE